jgi:hypothetical protein
MTGIISQSLLYCYMLVCTPLLKPSTASARHPLHVSTTDISFNKDDNKLEVICTIFTDDFEATIAKKYHLPTDLAKPAMHKAMDELVKKYIAAHIAIKTDATTATLNYLGFEKVNEAVNVYLESNKTAPFKKVDAEISLLHDQYQDQLNIVHITVSGVRKSTKLDYPDNKVVQTF